MIACYAEANYLGVLLTGMGNDGAAGMLVMKKAVVFNLMQDEASCLAVTMPKKAIIAGGADKGNVEKSRQRRSLPWPKRLRAGRSPLCRAQLLHVRSTRQHKGIPLRDKPSNFALRDAASNTAALLDGLY